MIRNILFSLFIICTTLCSAQVESASFGSTYVPQQGFVTIFGTHVFDFRDCGLYPGMILTDRDDPGFVNFGPQASWSGAVDDSHVDGYVRTYADGPFSFPIGDDGRLRMIAVSDAPGAAASYTFDDPANVTETMTISNEELDGVSASEYWTLSASDATGVTLTWDAQSGIEDMVDGDINKLTIVGWRNNDWEVIPSQINDFTLLNNSQNVLNADVSTSFLVGSLTSTETVDVAEFEYLTLGSLATPRSSVYSGTAASFVVYPTPVHVGVSSTVSYTLTGDRGKIEVFDGLNRLIYSQLLDEARGQVHLTDTNAAVGRYLITITNEDGTRASRFHFVVD